MLNVPIQIIELLKKDSVKKNFRVMFPNGEAGDIINDNMILSYDDDGNELIGAVDSNINYLISETISLKESLCSESKLKFGLCESSVLEFECNLAENVKGAIIKCYLEVDVSDIDVKDVVTLEYCCSPARKNTYQQTKSFDLKKYKDFVFKTVSSKLTLIKYRTSDYFGSWTDWTTFYSGAGVTEKTFVNTEVSELRRYIQFSLEFADKDCACYIYNRTVNGIEEKSDLPFKVYSIPYGTFIIDSCDRETKNMNIRKIEAYSPSLTDTDSLTDLKFGTWSGLSPVERFKMAYPVSKCDYTFDLDKFIYSNIPFMGKGNTTLTKFEHTDTMTKLSASIPINGGRKIAFVSSFLLFEFNKDTAKNLYYIKADRSSDIYDGAMAFLNNIIERFGGFDNQTLYSKVVNNLIPQGSYGFYEIKPDTTNQYTMLLNHNESFIYPWINVKNTERSSIYGTDKMKVGLLTKLSVVFTNADGTKETKVFTPAIAEPSLYIANTGLTQLTLSVARTQSAKKSKKYVCVLSEQSKRKKRVVAGNTVYDSVEDTTMLKKSSDVSIEYSLRSMAEAYLELNAVFGRWNRFDDEFEIVEFDRGKFIYPTKYNDTSKNIYPMFFSLYPHGDGYAEHCYGIANIKETYYESFSIGHLFPYEMSNPDADMYPNNGTDSSEKVHGFYQSAWWDDVQNLPYSCACCTYNEQSSTSSTSSEEVYTEYDIPKYYNGSTPVYYEDVEADNVQAYDCTDNWIITNIPVTSSFVVESLTKIGKALEGFRFMPSETTMIGLPYLEAGDWIKVYIDNNNYYLSPIMSRTITGVHSLTDKITADDE